MYTYSIDAPLEGLFAGIREENMHSILPALLFVLVRLPRLERGTLGLEVRCSIH